MDKREEIDRVLIKYTKRTGEHLDEVKRELSDLGVVVKVDRKEYFRRLRKSIPFLIFLIALNLIVYWLSS